LAGLNRPAAPFAALLACAVLTAAGCSEPTGGSVYGHWRAVLPVAGGDLPFGLEIAREGGRDVAWLINGPERVEVTDVKIDGSRVSMGMPGYPHRLEARLVDGRLEGEVVFLRPRGERKSARLVAERGVSWRFFPGSPGENADFSGRWALTFRDPEGGSESTGIAELAQQGRIVTGTVLRESGDDRYIAGEARGDTVFLSRFDGGSAFLYVARLNARGELDGEFRSATGTFRKMTGRRDAAAALADVTRLTQVSSDAGPLRFAFPDADGRTVSLADARFRDKVVILTIGGTWCPNCHDEARFLRDFLPSRRDRGLEVVQLMFEYTADFPAAAASVRRFTDEFGIGYPVLIAGSYEPGAVQRAIPQLTRFYAYPTMLVLDRSGRIRYTHTGFSGPATGAHHDEFAREFGEFVDGLLEEAGADPARGPAPQGNAASAGS
jgi:peroxiredoxin